MEEEHKELQLLPAQRTITSSSSSRIPRWPLESSPSMKVRSSKEHHHMHSLFEGPSLDLQLSISLRPFKPPQSNDCMVFRPVLGPESPDEYAETLKWQASEQIRLAAVEKAYAERVRELTRREMELAQTEFSRARQMWERAREEVDKADKLKERATRRIDPTSFLGFAKMLMAGVDSRGKWVHEVLFFLMMSSFVIDMILCLSRILQESQVSS